MSGARISPRELSRHGWTRVGSSAGKVNAEWRHREGWTLAHCGHPTALTPWMLKDPSGAMVLTGAQRGNPEHGTCWPDLATAVAWLAMHLHRKACA